MEKFLFQYWLNFFNQDRLNKFVKGFVKFNVITYG